MIVETGAGLSNSNSYVTTAESDAYADTEDNSAWTLQDDIAKEVFLVKASRVIDRTYGGKRYVGQRKTLLQAMDWPREGAVDKNGFDVSALIPPCLKVAVFEQAEQFRLGNTTTESSAAPATIKREHIEAGGVVLETEYMDGKVETSTSTESVSIESILAPILRYGARAVSLTRV